VLGFDFPIGDIFDAFAGSMGMDALVRLARSELFQLVELGELLVSIGDGIDISDLLGYSGGLDLIGVVFSLVATILFSDIELLLIV
jgi:hypothetical protein